MAFKVFLLGVATRGCPQSHGFSGPCCRLFPQALQILGSGHILWQGLEAGTACHPGHHVHPQSFWIPLPGLH